MARIALLIASIAAGLRWIWNSNEWSGPVVVRLTQAHGVHLNDWVAPLLVGLAMIVLIRPEPLARPLQLRARV
jgi:hypothetical protein